jgi:hypothetical protein
MTAHPKVTPEQFWQAFVKCLSDQAAVDLQWRDKWRSPTDWTAWMMRVLREVGRQLNFTHERGISTEYYRVDLGFFSIPDMPMIQARDRGYFWDCEVLIEHENNSDEWLDEWVKLQHLSAGLRVLISYDSGSKNPSRTAGMMEAAQIMRRELAHPVKGATLLVLGPGDDHPQAAFYAYLDTEAGFTPLGPSLPWHVNPE